MLSERNNVSMPETAGEGLRGAECKKALAPHIGRLRLRAVEMGWTPAEVGNAILALTADQLKDLGYGEQIH